MDTMKPEQEIDQLKGRVNVLEYENKKLKKNIIEISQAKELYLKIFENFPAFIWRSGLDMKCNYFNKTWLEFTGRTMAQESGNGWTEGVHPDDFELCLKTYVSSFEKKEEFVMEYRMKNKYGSYAWIRDFGRPFYDLDNSFLGYLGSCYDITENKNNEQVLLEMNATKDKFFSIISHDLRNPINTVIGLSDLLEKNVTKNDFHSVAEYAKHINQATRNIKKLVQNLLEWSVSNSGRMEFNPSKIQLKSIVKVVLELSEEMFKQKKIAVEVNLVENDEVYIDKEMISTVIRNFLTNAIKFSHPNGLISITSERTDRFISLSVVDNGVGMSPEILTSLFKIGETISNKGTNNETGTGIGLLLCKEFIEKHQGKIEVESEEGKGSSFKFILPIQNMDEFESSTNS